MGPVPFYPRPVPARTRLGSLIIVVSQAATLARIEPFHSWHTPIAWTSCGFAWELWNYPAGGKWIYSVPILPNLRLVEMPLPGYLGFPPFAVECFVMYVWVGARIWRTAARPVSI